jgi:hypothetical protein
MSAHGSGIPASILPTTPDTAEIISPRMLQRSTAEASASVPQTISDGSTVTVVTTKIAKRSGTAIIERKDGARKPAAPRVRVRLHRVHADLARAVPPDGNGRAWWARLKTALGTTSSAFVDASLHQLQASRRSPFRRVFPTGPYGPASTGGGLSLWRGRMSADGRAATEDLVRSKRTGPRRKSNE